MLTGRATMLIHGAAFVRERFGEAAHQQILALEPHFGPLFRGSLPEAERVPLTLILFYMKTAQALFAPEDAGFHRELGRFAAHRDRQGNLAHMVSDRDKLLKMVPTVWRTFFNAGSLEVTESGEHRLVLRAVDFAVDPALCERIAGVAEVHFQTGDVRHDACVFRGAPACEWQVAW